MRQILGADPPGANLTPKKDIVTITVILLPQVTRGPDSSHSEGQ